MIRPRLQAARLAAQAAPVFHAFSALHHFTCASRPLSGIDVGGKLPLSAWEVEMPNSFKTGDVVRLKSGGPEMTVSDGAASGTYLCHWFNREGDVWTPQHAGFKPDQLVVVDQPR
jgi:uncharacterized protein YodC (DUF2158 family)